MNGSVTELAYVGVEASNLADWETFGIEQLGMQLGHKDENTLTLRMDERAYRWYLTRGPADDLAFTGYECGSDASLDALAAALKSAGSPVREGDAALAAARRVRRLVITADPIGNRVELVTGHANAGTPFRSDKLVSRFVTGNGGAGHLVLMENGHARQPILDWYARLGFKLSDIIDEEKAPGVIASVAFLHCNPRHHTVALANMPIPVKMHHFMMEVADINDVGYANDRCMYAGRAFEMTLGMHPNDNMFSFYVRTPSGFSVEYGWGGRLVDDATWTVGHYDRLDSWGHKPAQLVASLLNA